MEMEEQGIKFRQHGHSRWLYFFLGVFLAAAIGLAIALGVVLTQKDDDGPVKVTAAPENSKKDVCVTPSCLYQASKMIQSMNKAADPCEDFYQYACGNWIQTHEIPKSGFETSHFTQIRDTTSMQLRDVLETAYDNTTEGATVRNMKTLYASCMDEAQIEKLGAKPLQDMINSTDVDWPLTSSESVNISVNLTSRLIFFLRKGSYPFIIVSPLQDLKNSTRYIIWIAQPKLQLPRNDLIMGRNSPVVLAYEEAKRQAAVRVLDVAPSDNLTKAIGEVIDFEIKLAKITSNKTSSELVDNYETMTIAQLSNSMPELNWRQLLFGFYQEQNYNATDDTEVAITGVQDYFKSLVTLLESTDKKIILNYMLMYLVYDHLDYLSKEYRDLKSPIIELYYGKSEPTLRWKTCLRVVENRFSFILELYYVSKDFTPADKNKVDEMVRYTRQSLKEMVSKEQWMDIATNNKVLEKVDAIIQLIGYPEENPGHPDPLQQTDVIYINGDFKPDSFFDNFVRASMLSVALSSKALYGQPDRSMWTVLTYDVNARYNPFGNSITIVAGFMHPPVYQGNYLMSTKFGALGMVIGHELTHGLDDSGRKFDKDGNLRPWWSNSSVENFEHLVSCFEEQYSQQVVAGQHVDGKLTAGENIADNGGIRASYRAFQDWQAEKGRQRLLPGLDLSQEQLFFLSFAQVWCTKMTDQVARQSLLDDTHSPNQVRVQVSLSNSQDFADAYKCPQGTPMNPVKKCVLW